MTVSTIRSLLRVLIDQPHLGVWSNTNLNTLIFSEYRDLCNAITERNPDYYTKSTSVVTIAANKFTALPSDCTIMKKLIDSDGNTTKWLHNSQFDHTSANAKPTRFDVVGRNIWWSPTPDAIYTYTAFHHYMPTDLSADSDTPELPPNFHDILAYGVAVNSRIAKEEQIDEYVMQYERKKKMLLHQIGISQTNNPRRVLRVYDESEE
jgi:hypothetical protein